MRRAKRRPGEGTGPRRDRLTNQYHAQNPNFSSIDKESLKSSSYYRQKEHRIKDFIKRLMSSSTKGQAMTEQMSQLPKIQTKLNRQKHPKRRFKNKKKIRRPAALRSISTNFARSAEDVSVGSRLLNRPKSRKGSRPVLGRVRHSRSLEASSYDVPGASLKGVNRLILANPSESTNQPKMSKETNLGLESLETGEGPVDITSEETYPFDVKRNRGQSSKKPQKRRNQGNGLQPQKNDDRDLMRIEQMLDDIKNINKSSVSPSDKDGKQIFSKKKTSIPAALRDPNNTKIGSLLQGKKPVKSPRKKKKDRNEKKEKEPDIVLKLQKSSRKHEEERKKMLEEAARRAEQARDSENPEVRRVMLLGENTPFNVNPGARPDVEQVESSLRYPEHGRNPQGGKKGARNPKSGKKGQNWRPPRTTQKPGKNGLQAPITLQIPRGPRDYLNPGQKYSSSVQNSVDTPSKNLITNTEFVPINEVSNLTTPVNAYLEAQKLIRKENLQQEIIKKLSALDPKNLKEGDSLTLNNILRRFYTYFLRSPANKQHAVASKLTQEDKMETALFLVNFFTDYVEKLKNESKRKASDIEMLKFKIGDLQNEAKGLRKQNDLLAQHNEELREMKERSARDRAVTEEDLQRMQNQANEVEATYQESIQKYKQMLAEGSQNFNMVKDENAGLQRALEEAKKKADKQFEKAENLKSQISGLKKFNRDLEDEAQRLREEVREREGNVDVLERDLQLARQDAARVENERFQLQQENGELKVARGERDRLQDEVRQAHDRNQELQNEQIDLNSKIEYLEKFNKMLKNEDADLRNKLKSYRNELLERNLKLRYPGNGPDLPESFPSKPPFYSPPKRSQSYKKHPYHHSMAAGVAANYSPPKPFNKLKGRLVEVKGFKNPFLGKKELVFRYTNRNLGDRQYDLITGLPKNDPFARQGLEGGFDDFEARRLNLGDKSPDQELTELQHLKGVLEGQLFKMPDHPKKLAVCAIFGFLLIFYRIRTRRGRSRTTWITLI